MKSNKHLKVAITHDYLIEYGGAEKVLETILDMFPEADVFTPILWLDSKHKDFLLKLKEHKIITSSINKYENFFKRVWKLFLPNFVNFFEKLDLSNYDLVISSSTNFSKWLNLSKKTKHIAYIHTPPRFLWGLETNFFYKIPSILRTLISRKQHEWKNKDYNYAHKATALVANSKTTAKNIAEFYKKDVQVIYPPVTAPNRDDKKAINYTDFYVIVNRLVAHKKIDQVIKAFNSLNKKLIIIGEGPEKGFLEKLANSNIHFTGFLEESIKYSYIKHARALIYSGREDFGIGIVEALQLGTPVIAYNGGGAKEIINKPDYGVLFDEHDSESINKALNEFETKTFNKEELIRRGQSFNKEVFVKKFKSVLNSL